MNHGLEPFEKNSSEQQVDARILAFIFTNLLLTLLFRAIAEELYCKGSEPRWITERCQVTQNGSESHYFWTLYAHQ